MASRLVYTWNCCASLSGYTDAFGTAVLTYDDLGRLLSNTDSAGSEVEYEYDALGRVVKLTPPQGADYRTQYVYNKNGSLASASVYDAGSPAVTDYAYSTASGRLLTRDFPEESSNRIRTAYAYDAAGRLEYETVTRESGGTTNLYRTQYAYSWLSYGRQVLRTETEWGGSSWDNSARLTYKYNAPGWQDYEERAEWVASAWVQRYEVAQEYDKNGNRTRYHRNVQGGQTGTYGRNMDLNYTYGELNNPATVTDADDIYYAATFGVDGNLNITQVVETSGPYSTLYNYYDHDGLNRVTANRVKYYDGFDWQWIKRQHEYSATGAILRSTYKEWEDGDSEPSGDALLHSWGQDGRSVQNTNTAGNAFGSVWHWAGSGSTGNGPLKSPNADTASQDGYNVGAGGGAGTPVRRSFINPTTEGDQRNLWAQGMPNAKDSVGAWTAGTVSVVTNSLGVEPSVESRFEFEGTVAPTDLSRATDAREKGRVGMFGSGYSYAGSSGRFTSETIGRDINPLGRGDGMAYVGGMVNLGQIAPVLPSGFTCGGYGNSVNNSCNGDDYPLDCKWHRNSSEQTCWCSCCDNPYPCVIQTELGLGSLVVPRCCPKKCSYGTVKCVGHGEIDCPFTDHKCDLKSHVNVHPNVQSFPDFCETERVPDTAPSEVYQGNASPSFSGSGWMPIRMFKFKNELDKACRKLLGCCYLPSKVKNCIRQLCGRLSGLIVYYGEGLCSQRNWTAYVPHGGVACYFGGYAGSNVSMYICKPEGLTAGTIAHEMLHLCDCNISKSGTRRCTAFTENANSTYTQLKGFVARAEAFAHSCASCCIFGFDTYDPDVGYYLRFAAGTSACCSCLECY